MSLFIDLLIVDIGQHFMPKGKTLLCLILISIFEFMNMLIIICSKFLFRYKFFTEILHALSGILFTLLINKMLIFYYPEQKILHSDNFSCNMTI